MITIDDKEYTEEDLTDAQKYLVAQVQDIDSKIRNLQFQLDQLSVAKDAFSNQVVLSVRESVDSEEPATDATAEPTATAEPVTAAQ
jgi:prefoldin subunit 5